MGSHAVYARTSRRVRYQCIQVYASLLTLPNRNLWPAMFLLVLLLSIKSRVIGRSPITRPRVDHRGGIVDQPERKSREWFYPLHSALPFQAPPALEFAMSTATLRDQRLAMDIPAPVKARHFLLSSPSSPISQANAGLSSTGKVFFVLCCSWKMTTFRN